MYWASGQRVSLRVIELHPIESFRGGYMSEHMSGDAGTIDHWLGSITCYGILLQSWKLPV